MSGPFPIKPETMCRTYPFTPVANTTWETFRISLVNCCRVAPAPARNILDRPTTARSWVDLPSKSMFSKSRSKVVRVRCPGLVIGPRSMRVTSGSTLRNFIVPDPTITELNSYTGGESKPRIQEVRLNELLENTEQITQAISAISITSQSPNQVFHFRLNTEDGIDFRCWLLRANAKCHVVYCFEYKPVFADDNAVFTLPSALAPAKHWPMRLFLSCAVRHPVQQ